MLSENLKKKKNRTDTAVLKKTDTENRTDLEKIPSEIPKTDTELKNRHRPKSKINTFAASLMHTTAVNQCNF